MLFVVRHSAGSCQWAFTSLAIIALMSIDGLALQAPTKISDVAKLVRTVTDGDATYPVFEYEGVAVRGDLAIQEYREGITLVRPRLQPAEQIIEVSASQQVPLDRRFGKDLMVRTCIEDCENRFPDSGSGRIFVLERVNGIFELFTILSWIA
jgi:hypothetical protein